MWYEITWYINATHSLEWKDSGNHGLYGGIFNRTGDSSGTETASLYEVLEFGGARVAHLFSSVLCLCVCLSSSCVLCTQCYQCFWIFHSWLALRFPLTFIYSVFRGSYWLIWEPLSVFFSFNLWLLITHFHIFKLLFCVFLSSDFYALSVTVWFSMLFVTLWLSLL